MATFLSGIGTLFTEVVQWMGTLITTIMNNPALTIVTFGLLIVGAVFGYTSRLIKGR